MAEIVRYVDTDVVGGAGDGTSWANAYHDLFAMEDAEETNLDTANNWLHVYVSASAGTVDNTATSIVGWTTSATDYILIEAANEAGHYDRAKANGWDNAKYRLSITNANALTISEDFVRIDGIQIEVVNNTVNRNAIQDSTASASGSDVRISNCRLRGSTNSQSINFNTVYLTAYVWNCIIGPCGNRGVYIGQGVAVYIYNSTIHHTGDDGVYAGGAVNITVWNCAIFDTADDIYFSTSGTKNLDYCALDDADAQTHPITESGGGSGWPNDFTDSANGDCTLVAGSGLIGTGAVDPADPLFDDDIEGTTRGAAWDVGAFEYVSSGNHALTADPITIGTPALDSPSITQNHAFGAPTALTTTPTLGSPALSQNHVLAANGLAIGTPSLGTPVLSINVSLTANPLTVGTPVLGSPTITQNHAISAVPLVVGAPQLATPAISQNHALGAAGLAVGVPTLGTPILSEGTIYYLTALNLLVGAPALASPTITQNHALGAEVLTIGTPSLGMPALSGGGIYYPPAEIIEGSSKVTVQMAGDSTATPAVAGASQATPAVAGESLVDQE